MEWHFKADCIAGGFCLREMWTPLEHASRYEFYSGKKTKIAPKPFPRYDSNCATNPVTLLQHVPRYDPRSGANSYNQLKIITWNIVLEKKKLIGFS